MNIKAALRALITPTNGEAAPTVEEVLAEANALRVDHHIEQLQREGLLNADPASVDYARRAIERDGDEYLQHIRAARPAPAAPAAVLDPTAPADPTEAEIQALVADGMPYHQAAAEVSKGASLKD